jgi:hypothetical protein
MCGGKSEEIEGKITVSGKLNCFKHGVGEKEIELGVALWLRGGRGLKMTAGPTQYPKLSHCVHTC